MRKRRPHRFVTLRHDAEKVRKHRRVEIIDHAENNQNQDRHDELTVDIRHETVFRAELLIFEQNSRANDEKREQRSDTR